MRIDDQNKNKRFSCGAFFEAIAEIAFWTAIWNLITD
jgi:hypothetical protein